VESANKYCRPQSIRINKLGSAEDTKGFGSLFSEGDPDAGNSALRLGLAVSDKYHRDASEAFTPGQQSQAQSAYGGYRG
jgi:hypothetical protein